MITYHPYICPRMEKTITVYIINTLLLVEYQYIHEGTSKIWFSHSPTPCPVIANCILPPKSMCYDMRNQREKNFPDSRKVAIFMYIIGNDGIRISHLKYQRIKTDMISWWTSLKHISIQTPILILKFMMGKIF